MKRNHRIFIAIHLPADVKRFLAKYETKYADMPARWTPEENLHITLVFLGELSDVEVGEVCMAAKAVAAKHSTLDVRLEKVAYGPDGKLPPKMLWAIGEKSAELSALKDDLQQALLEKIQFVPEKRAYTPHITLARVHAFAWRQINPEERPEVGEDIDLNFSVESIDVMESELKKGGPKYTAIESMPLS